TTGWNMLNFSGHGILMVGNLMNGIDLWINMWRSLRRHLVINSIKLWQIGVKLYKKGFSVLISIMMDHLDGLNSKITICAAQCQCSITLMSRIGGHTSVGAS
ncbi:hypothetical protein DVA81_18105, partial [Acinetobacter baumannii]